MKCHDYISITVPNKTTRTDGLKLYTRPLDNKADTLPQDQPGSYCLLWTLIQVWRCWFAMKIFMCLLPDSNMRPLNKKTDTLPQDQPVYLGKLLSLALIADSNSGMKGRQLYFLLPSKDDDVPWLHFGEKWLKNAVPKIITYVIGFAITKH